jgi:hypothetical protein
MAEKPKDYQTKSREPFEVPLPPAADDHLDPEPPKAREPERVLHGIFRYMGDTTGVDFYGIWFDRKEWIEVYDPFIAKKARGNVTFDTKGKDLENEVKQKRREQFEKDRETYIKIQAAKQKRAERNADAVLGRED